MSARRPPVDQISHYRLEEMVGEGTFGVVWRGVHHRDPELQVAVKVLRPELTGDADFIESLKGACRRLDPDRISACLPQTFRCAHRTRAEVVLSPHLEQRRTPGSFY